MPRCITGVLFFFTLISETFNISSFRVQDLDMDGIVWPFVVGGSTRDPRVMFGVPPNIPERSPIRTAIRRARRPRLNPRDACASNSTIQRFT